MSDRHALTLSALIPAAGSSSRLGLPKQLVKWRGETLIHRMARQLLELGAETVTVVLGHEADRVLEALADLPVVSVVNDRWQAGMGSTIAVGCSVIPQDVDGILLSLCDQWRLGPGDLCELKNAWAVDPTRPVAAEWQIGETLAYGAPAIFPAALLDELKSIDAGQGAKAVLARHSERTVRVPMQSAATDLDTPADLKALRAAQRM